MQRQLTKQELLVQTNKEKLIAAEQAKAAAHAVDLFNLGSIFLVKGMPLLEPLFEVGLKFVMLPLAALSIGAMAGITWYQAHQQKYAAFPVYKAVLETVKFLAIATAVVGALALPIYFAVAGPAIFAATFAVMTLINFGTAIYNGIMAAKTKITNPVKHAEYRERAIDSTKAAIVGTIATAAITAVMIFKMPILSVMGVFAGVLGGVIAVVKFNELYQKRTALKALAAAPEPVEDGRTNNAELAARLNIRGDGYEPVPTEAEPGKQVEFAAKPGVSPTLFQPAGGKTDQLDSQEGLQKAARSTSSP